MQEQRKSALHEAVRLPLVSVIITSFNYRRFVLQAIESVRAQTYRSFECIVVDDNSTDGSFELVNEYIASTDDERFRSIRLGKNLGQMGAIKAGFENSRGVFVAILDADDKWLPTFLDQHIAAHLNGSFSAAISASDTLQINENDELLETTFHTHAKYRTAYPGYPIQPVLPEAEAQILDGEIRVGEPSVPPLFHVDQEHKDWSVVAMSALVFRRSVLELIVPANTEPSRICADYYLVRFAHIIGGTLTIWSQLSCFRMHRANNFSNSDVVGGRYLPGNFHADMRWKLEYEIARHIIDNFSTMARAMGAERCRQIIRRTIPRSSLYKAVKHQPAVAALFGRSRAFFKFKYGMLYPILKKQ